MADLSPRINAEADRYMALLERLGQKLGKTLDDDVKANGTAPSRDWARSFGNYGQGMRGMLAEQRERLKLQAGKHADITDEQFAAEMKELGLQTLHELPADTLTAALEARGLKVEAVDE